MLRSDFCHCQHCFFYLAWAWNCFVPPEAKRFRLFRTLRHTREEQRDDGWVFIPVVRSFVTLAIVVIYVLFNCARSTLRNRDFDALWYFVTTAMSAVSILLVSSRILSLRPSILPPLPHLHIGTRDRLGFFPILYIETPSILFKILGHPFRHTPNCFTYTPFARGILVPVFYLKELWSRELRSLYLCPDILTQEKLSSRSHDGSETNPEQLPQLLHMGSPILFQRRDFSGVHGRLGGYGLEVLSESLPGR